MEIILYSTHCPKCIVLEKKLKQKAVAFKEINDVSIMESKGFMSAPMLEVDGEIFDFTNANKWINGLG